MSDTPFNEHSPLPFELDFFNWQIKDKTGNIIIQLEGNFNLIQLDDNFNLTEDASFIIKACNGYYKLTRDNAALLEALKEMISAAEQWCDAIEIIGSGWDDWDYHYKKMKYTGLAQARAAIAVVEEKP